MKTFRADEIKRDDPVWLWDGGWLAAVVADVLFEKGDKLVIVRFESGGSAPALVTDLNPRDPAARGSDRPRSHRQQGSSRGAA